MSPEQKISKGIHKTCNADLIIEDVKYPCNHNTIDSQRPMYDRGHAHRTDLHCTIVVPAFNLKGVAVDIYSKINVGDVVQARSRKRSALSHRFRVASLALDEASVTITATDDRR